MEKNEIIRILSEAEPLLEKAYAKSEEIPTIKSQVPEYKDPNEAAKKKPIFRIILCAFSLLFTILGILDIIFGNGITIPFIIVTIISLLLIVDIRNASTTNRKNAEENNRKRETLLAQVDSASRELNELVNKYNATGINNVLSTDYQSVQCIHLVKSYLINGRADTMKEALNLFEEELHRYRVEMNSQNAAQAAKDAADAARWNAVGTWINTFKN